MPITNLKREKKTTTSSKNEQEKGEKHQIER